MNWFGHDLWAILRLSVLRFPGGAVSRVTGTGGVVSVDTKKKELVGDFKNGGREWQPKGEPEPVRVHDFIDKELGKVIPYGVYDTLRNEAWVSVGVDHDTAKFAVATLERWWREMGKKAYPDATELRVTADGAGSNASRSRLWRVELLKKVGFPRGDVVRPLWPAPAFRRSSAVPGLASRVGVGVPMLPTPARPEP